MRSTSKFQEAVAEAASQVDHRIADPGAEWLPTGDDIHANPGRPEDVRRAQQEAVAAFTAAAARITEQYGCAVIWKKPRVGRKRTRAEYGFWKGPIMSFIEFPETLDLGPTALARRHAPFEANFVVTKDTFRAPLSGPARKEAKRLLISRGFKLALPAAFSIRDVQKAMKDQRDRAAGVQRFNPQIEIVGDTVTCDGRSYKMSPTGSGKSRIRAGGGWLPVEALSAFLSGQQG